MSNIVIKKYFIHTYIIKKFDVSYFLLEVPNFYGNNPKNETKLSYLILSYIYFQKFKKILNLKLIVKNEYGKPMFKDSSLFFNISHSKNYICCSLSNINIGVDIEEKRKLNQNSKNRFLTKKELLINSIDPLKYWVIKEAYSKYLGLGLKIDFSKISVENIRKNFSVIEKMYFFNEYEYLLFCLIHNYINNAKIDLIYNNITKDKIINYYKENF